MRVKLDVKKTNQGEEHDIMYPMRGVGQHIVVASLKDNKVHNKNFSSIYFEYTRSPVYKFVFFHDPTVELVVSFWYSSTVSSEKV